MTLISRFHRPRTRCRSCVSTKLGEARDIRVAWVRSPEFRVEPTHQRHTRVAKRQYRFENLDSGYSVEILMDGAGLVIEYPDLRKRSPNP